MNKVYILLGSNIGDCLGNIKTASKKISTIVGSIERKSSIYQTEAWGNIVQPDFLNQIIIIETKKSAEETIAECLKIEKEMGRLRLEKNSPRSIDIDILFFNRSVIDTAILKIPHPEIQNRKFVLIPLAELSPNKKHPVLNLTVKQLLTNCTDKLRVKKISNV